MLARLEGKPLPRGQALADVLGVSPAAAWRLVRGLRRRGALKVVSLVGPGTETCECLTYLKVDWAGDEPLQALDDWIVGDPAILIGARVTGAYDYRLVSRHQSFQAANAWSRSLTFRAKVARVLTQFCTTRFDRPHYAAALLGTDEASAVIPFHIAPI